MHAKNWLDPGDSLSRRGDKWGK